MESISLPRREFAQELCRAIHDRDHASFWGTLACKPELALYQRIYEGPGFREYLQRNTDGQQAARVRFQLRSGTSMLRQHDSRFRDQPSHDRADHICPACKEIDSIQSIQHVLLHCPAYEHRRGQLYVRRLHVSQGHRPLPLYCLMLRESLPYYEMTCWEEQRRQL